MASISYTQTQQNVFDYAPNQENEQKSFRRTPSQVELRDFRALTQVDAVQSLQKELNKLLLTAPQTQQASLKAEFEGFESLFRRFLQESETAINWNRIEPLPKQSIVNYRDIEISDLAKNHQNVKTILGKLVVLKLNGGLGTSMGCQGPKSIIRVRDELTFLDLTIKQLENINNAFDTDVPLILMNSFNTDEETNKVISKYSHIRVPIHTFNQSRFPRIDRETLLPIAKTTNGNEAECWYPPGHGDLYEAFYNSGLLRKFIDQGKEYIFVSNTDNLGASVDINILNYLINPPVKPAPEFVMEVTDKTRADVKGGTLIHYDGKLKLLEIAQVPKDHVEEFKSVSKFKIFNTNNLWINLKAIERLVGSSALQMEVIVNNKTTDKGLNVIQLETASGSAIKCFDNPIGINVPRSRFLPVKTTSDLLLVMSNLFTLRKGLLEMNPLRSFPSVPLVKLGSAFVKVNEFLKRFGNNIPDCLELDHLTVSGDVTFGRGVVLRGTVIIIANHGDRIDIPSGSILENKIVSGNLRILDH